MANKTASRANGRKPSVHVETTVERSITTAVHLPLETWQLLRAVAFRRAQESGGRASVSKLLAGLVEERRGQLEKELSVK